MWQDLFVKHSSCPNEMPKIEVFYRVYKKEKQGMYLYHLLNCHFNWRKYQLPLLKTERSATTILGILGNLGILGIYINTSIT